MERALAKHVVARTYRAAGEITSLLPLLKAHCSDEEYRSLARAVARAAAEIKSNVIDLIYAQHPEVERDVELDIERYERVL